MAFLRPEGGSGEAGHFHVFLILAMLPVFYWNQILYGFPYFGGYRK